MKNMRKYLNSTTTLENNNYKICIFFLFYVCKKIVKQQNKTNTANHKIENNSKNRTTYNYRYRKTNRT